MGSFVVSSPEVYKSACEKDLDKPMAYQIGPQDTEPQNLIKYIEDSISRLVNSIVDNGEIKKEIADWILIKEKDFKLARYYANWKCHSFKPPVFSFAEAAVRGIILCIGTSNERVYDFLYFLLNPGMRSGRSYSRDTKEIKMQYPVLPDHFSWLLIDFVAMYSD